jgi:hypothetical protein
MSFEERLVKIVFYSGNAVALKADLRYGGVEIADTVPEALCVGKSRWVFIDLADFVQAWKVWEKYSHCISAVFNYANYLPGENARAHEDVLLNFLNVYKIRTQVSDLPYLYKKPQCL